VRRWRLRAREKKRKDSLGTRDQYPKRALVPQARSILVPLLLPLPRGEGPQDPVAAQM